MPYISDSGGGVYQSGSTPGSWPTNAKRVFLSVGVGAWVEIASGYFATSVNYIAGTANWINYFTTSKGAPAVTVASCSAKAGLTVGRPSTISWTEGTGGNGYTLCIQPVNLSTGARDTLITLPPGRSGTGQTYQTPAGWNSGDEVYFSLFYQNANGVNGPFVNTNTIILP